jgi:hypothetical protein
MHKSLLYEKAARKMSIEFDTCNQISPTVLEQLFRLFHYPKVKLNTKFNYRNYASLNFFEVFIEC